MNKNGIFRLGVSGSAIALAVSMPAFAQQATSQPAADVAAVPSQEIVVTAMKRSGTAQSAPASVSVLSGEQLKRSGATDLDAIVHLTPGITFSDHAGSTFIQIRGAGNVVDTGESESSNALYVDGIFLPRPSMALLSAVDLDRVEVLRGPQGTLYGRNATTGSINLISVAPSNHFTAGLTAGGGSYDFYRANGYVSGPLSDALSVRVSGGAEGREGYIINSLGPNYEGYHTQFGRISLKYDNGGPFTANLFTSYTYRNGTPNQNELEYFGPGSALHYAPAGVNQGDPRPNHAADPYTTRNPSKTLIVGLNADYKLAADLTLHSTTGYVNHKSAVYADDGNDSLYRFAEIHPSYSYSQEFDLIGKRGPANFVLGANYFHESFTYSVPFSPVNYLAQFYPINYTDTQGLREVTKSLGLFGDVTLSLTSHLRLLGGVRYTHEVKNSVISDNTTYSTAVGGPIVPLLTAPYADDGTRLGHVAYNPVTFKAGAQLDLAPHIMAYATFSQGFKSGGANNGAFSPHPYYLPEKLNAYEAGLKTELFDRKLTLNVAGFHYDYNNYQILNVINAFATEIDNGDAKLTGFEGEFSYSPSTVFNVRGGATYLPVAKFTNFNEIDLARLGTPDVNLDGYRISRAAKFSANGSIDYTFPVQSKMMDSVTLAANGRYSSSLIYRVFNENPLDSSQPYFNLDFSATVKKDNWSLRGFVTNVTNKIYLDISIYCTTCDARLGHWSLPRMWGLELSTKY